MGGGVCRHSEVVVRREQAKRDVACLGGVDLGLKRGGQQVGGEEFRAGGDAVVAAEGEPAAGVDPCLRVEAFVR